MCGSDAANIGPKYLDRVSSGKCLSGQALCSTLSGTYSRCSFTMRGFTQTTLPLQLGQGSPRLPRQLWEQELTVSIDLKYYSEQFWFCQQNLQNVLFCAVCVGLQWFSCLAVVNLLVCVCVCVCVSVCVFLHRCTYLTNSVFSSRVLCLNYIQLEWTSIVLCRLMSTFVVIYCC
jgi:hypothetical protein